MNVKIDISGVILKTDRLILREWTYDDLDDFYEYASVDGVGQMAGWAPHENKEKSLEILTKFIDEKKTFAIEFNNKVIGSLGIEKYNEEALPELKDVKAREIGFVLSKAYWGMGIMPEAVKEVINYLFNDVIVDAIICGHFLTNNQSKRVQEKCGFQFLKQHLYKTKMGEEKLANFNILYR